MASDSVCEIANRNRTSTLNSTPLPYCTSPKIGDFASEGQACLYLTPPGILKKVSEKSIVLYSSSSNSTSSTPYYERSYERGAVIILDGQAKSEVLRRLVEFSGSYYLRMNLRKFGIVNGVVGWTNTERKNHGYLQKYDKMLLELVERSREEIEAVLLKQIFPNYILKFHKLHIRFTPHKDEIVHFDAMRAIKHKLFLRVMINVDSIPRLWAISQRYHEVARNLNISVSSYKSCEKLLRTINGKVKKASHAERCENLMPRIYLNFPPGTVWLSEPRLRSHTVVNGRRAISFDWYVENRRDPLTC